MSVRGESGPASTTEATRGAPWQAVMLEVFGSLAAAGAVVLIFLHYHAVRVTFFGAEAIVHPEDVRFYWILVAVLAVGVVASFVGAFWRGGGRSVVWHSVVAVAGLMVALVFSVTEAGNVQDLDDRPVQQERPDPPGNPVCHSGGDSTDCEGG